MGQIANVGGHHHETLAKFAGAGRFNRAVHRQHVGLNRNRGNGVHDLVNPATDQFQRVDLVAALAGVFQPLEYAFNQFVYRSLVLGQQLGHGLAFFHRLLGLLVGNLRAFLDLGNRGGGFLRPRALLGRTLADLINRGGDLRCGAIDFLHRSRQFFSRRRYFFGALGDVGAVLEVFGQAGQILSRLLGLGQRLGLLADGFNRFFTG